MFCPNCGKKIEISNQKFCQNCGCELPIVSEILPSRSSPQPTLQDTNVQFVERRPVNIKGPYSKRTLGFGIASLILAVTTFNIGSSFITIPNYGYFVRFVSIAFIVFGIIHIVGLILGIASKINNQQAKKLEPINNFIKAGNVLGIIGIILNTILMVISFAIVGLFG